METIIQTVDVLVNVLLIFFLMKLVVKPREFYFNPALRPVDAVTKPVLDKLRLYFRPTQYGFDYTPLIAIVSLIIIRLATYWLLVPGGFLVAAIISTQRLIQFLLSFFAFSVFVLSMVPVYSRNPLSAFLKTVVKPFEKPFQSLSTGKLPSLFGALGIAILICTVILGIGSALLAENVLQALANWKLWAVTGIRMVMISISIYRFIVILLIASVVLSWMDIEVKHPLVNLVFILTEPILLPIRRRLPPSGGFDITPWVACMCIGFLGYLMNSILWKLIAHIG